MTDRELVDAAWAKLMLTTISGKTYKAKPRPGYWEDAKALLDQVGTAPPPPPPTGWVVAPPQAPITTITGAATIALNLNSTSQPRLYQDYVIDDTGDSAVLVQLAAGPGIVLERFHLTNVAKRSAVTWGKHGCYAKAVGITIRDWYASNGGYASDGISARHSALLVERFECWGFAFPVAYFDEGEAAGQPLVFRHGKGDGTSDTAVWMDTNSGTSVAQSFEFEDCHFTGAATAVFLRCSAGKFAGRYVKLTGCTMNGNPVTASLVTGIPADKLFIA